MAVARGALDEAPAAARVHLAAEAQGLQWLEDGDVLALSDAGYQGYGNIITTSQKLVNEKPDVVQRFINAGGFVENEGDVQVPPMSPYPISYRSIVPRAAECENLLVPVCLSASHIAYGSIRVTSFAPRRS